MAKVSKQSAKYEDYGPVEAWHDEVAGYAIEFVTFKQDIDSTPMLKGLPNDQCHCPHWGYVLKGRVTFTVDGKGWFRVETLDGRGRTTIGNPVFLQ